MTAVPPRPAATQTNCRRTGPLTWCNHPSYACKRGECYLAKHLTAPDATAGDGLRSELLTEFGTRFQPRSGMSERAVERLADAVLALPALRDVLAAAARDAEKVRRVEELADEWAGHAWRNAAVFVPGTCADRIRRALDPS